MQGDALLQAVLQLILECAFGQPANPALHELPLRKACVDVTLRESAYDPIRGTADDTILGYERFAQHMAIRVGLCYHFTSVTWHYVAVVRCSCHMLLSTGTLPPPGLSAGTHRTGHRPARARLQKG